MKTIDKIKAFYTSYQSMMRKADDNIFSTQLERRNAEIINTVLYKVMLSAAEGEKEFLVVEFKDEEKTKDGPLDDINNYRPETKELFDELTKVGLEPIIKKVSTLDNNSGYGIFIVWA